MRIEMAAGIRSLFNAPDRKAAEEFLQAAIQSMPFLRLSVGLVGGKSCGRVYGVRFSARASKIHPDNQ